MDILRLYPLLTINLSINLQVGIYGTFQWSMFADTQANAYKQTNFRRNRNY